MTWWMALFIYACVVNYLFGQWVGYEQGVKDTEERWSNAVKVKEARDRYETRRTIRD